MSTGIFQSLQELSDLETRKSSGVQSEFSSEQPTVADLVLPGTGYNFSDEFACLMNVLGGAKGD
jgi:hypothetical protein